MHVKGSKTDQFREEATIVLDATGGELCPVAALLQYANLRGTVPLVHCFDLKFFLFVFTI